MAAILSREDELKDWVLIRQPSTALFMTKQKQKHFQSRYLSYLIALFAIMRQKAKEYLIPKLEAVFHPALLSIRQI